jgi:hypothetical protein
MPFCPLLVFAAEHAQWRQWLPRDMSNGDCGPGGTCSFFTPEPRGHAHS